MAAAFGQQADEAVEVAEGDGMERPIPDRFCELVQVIANETS